ncbi:MAG: PDZ domain-containing protein [Candidatus Sulfobium sp.]
MPWIPAALLCAAVASSCAASRFGTREASSSYCRFLQVPPASAGVSKPRPFLGVTFSPKNVGRRVSSCNKDSAFVEVAGVMAGTPAAEAGLKKGDIILSLNGTSLCRAKGEVADAFRDMIAGERIGSVASLEILRGDEKLTASARLTEAPRHEQPEAAHHKSGCLAGPPSALCRALRRQEALPSFNEIRAGLRETSDRVHNAAWFYKGRYNPFQLKEFTYLIRHPLEDAEEARKLTDGLIAAAHGEDFRVGSVMLRMARLLDVEEVGPAAPKKGGITFPGLIKAMEAAKARLRKCFDRLTPGERKLLRQKALNPWDDSRWRDIVRASLEIDFTGLVDSFSPLLPFFSRHGLSLLRADLVRRFGGNGRAILYEADTPLGKVVVGGTGPNVYRKDAALVLDLGGDDVYLNNAGGTRPGIPVAAVIDWGGNDFYQTKENFSQGAGLLGGGFLFDLGGDDVFESLDGSQGSGFFGVGILYHGRGKGLFRARTFSQGVGEMGTGLVLNGDGETRYLCSGEGQGLGLFRGLGVLIDEKGDDYYELGGLQPDFRDPAKSSVSMGQGFGWGIRPEDDRYGVSGGIGMLIDGEGDDIYNADYFAQGASYYYGAGILDDLSGDDRYAAGRYAQGAGIHSSVGILTDREGSDFYYSSFGVSQGMGHDYGVGFLEDGQGDDRYLGGILSQGAATRGGAGILLDGRGTDHYMCGTECQAFAQDERCVGILADGEPWHDVLSRYSKPEPVRLGIKKAIGKE